MKRLFISYAGESEEYRDWVRRLATRFRAEGVEVRLDYWHFRPTDSIAEFMKREIRQADWVLVLCSPTYRSKIQASEEGQRSTGVGWEARLLTDQLFSAAENKILVALAKGSWSEAAPDFLQGKLYCDLSNPSNFESNFKTLLHRITGMTFEKAPPLCERSVGLEASPPDVEPPAPSVAGGWQERTRRRRDEKPREEASATTNTTTGADSNTGGGGRGEEDVEEQIRFTVRHPKEVTPDEWRTLLAYVHLESALEQVRSDIGRRLGTEAATYGEAKGRPSQTIQREAEITVVPELPGCRFNPSFIQFGWLEDWHCAEFRLQADPRQPGFDLGGAVNGRVGFYVGPILLAEVRIWTYITEESTESVITETHEQGTVSPYRVFVSYSHEDADLVDSLEQAYSALRIEYLRDVRKLRSGERWQEALLGMIDSADIFQLCWSNKAKRSRHVEQEWRHALGRNRPSFVRPMYWEKPMPEPPQELSHLHFQFLDLRLSGSS